jgi:uncharacterized protein YukE
MSSTNLTVTQFKVDLGQMEEAIPVVAAQARIIDQNCADIKTLMAGVMVDWNSPAGKTFAELVPKCDHQMEALTNLLAQMSSRLKAAYHTYVTMEQTNLNNLT